MKEMFFGSWGIQSEDSMNYNLSSWELTSLTSCSEYIPYSNPTKLCHPRRLLELGCYSTCCETSIARSDYSAARSLTGVIGNSSIEVTCDTGYSHVTDSNVLTCDNGTGIYDGWELLNCTGHKIILCLIELSTLITSQFKLCYTSI